MVIKAFWGFNGSSGAKRVCFSEHEKALQFRITCFFSFRPLKIASNYSNLHIMADTIIYVFVLLSAAKIS